MRLLITGCSDPLLWYAGMVGSHVPYDRSDGEVYWAFQPEGYRNIVFTQDAELVETPIP